MREVRRTYLERRPPTAVTTNFRKLSPAAEFATESRSFRVWINSKVGRKENRLSGSHVDAELAGVRSHFGDAVSEFLSTMSSIVDAIVPLNSTVPAILALLLSGAFFRATVGFIAIFSAPREKRSKRAIEVLEVLAKKKPPPGPSS